MEIRQFRYFVRIVDTGSMSRAAQALFVAQSALSEQMRKLEDEVGRPLLQRSARGVTMTEAGERFYQTAVRVLRDVEDVKAELQGSRLRPRGKVTVGMPNSIAQLCTKDLVTRVSAELPDVVLSLFEATSAALPELLLVGRLNFAITFEEDLTKGFTTVRLFDDRLYLVEPVASDDPASQPEPAPAFGQPTATIADLAGKRLAVAQPTNTVRRLVDSACRVYGVSYHMALEGSSPTAVHSAVHHGGLATIGPWSIVHSWAQNPRLRIREIVEPSLSRTVVLAQPADATPTDAACAVMEILAELVRGLAPETQPPGDPDGVTKPSIAS